MSQSTRLGLLGRKVGMMRLFTDDGDAVPVTVVDVSDNRVSQVKTQDNDGYVALQVTYGSRRASRVTKPQAGHLAKAGVQAGEITQEFRVEADTAAKYAAGAKLPVTEVFAVGQKVDVQGTSIGKGFAGTIKRHNFRSQRASHGNSRSHNVPAQVTTLGKRFASAADELLIAFNRLEELIARYPLRGIKGPVGTAQDMLDLMGGDEGRLGQLESAVARHLGFAHVLDSVGQVYPRSLDLDVVSALVQVAAGPSSLATTIRLMAGHDLVTEGFRPGQVGSSAMPHKMNSRSCERVNGFAVLLRGYLTMVADLSGSQWNEGDVFCSVVRRVALPDAFFAIDGMFETFLTVLDDFGAFPAVIDRELERYLPFLSTTKVLMASVRKGVGRETAHEAIKEHAVAVALAMRESGQSANDLMDRLAADSRLGLSEDELRSLVADPLDFTGAAASQVRAVAERVAAISARYPDAAGYRPGDIL